MLLSQDITQLIPHRPPFLWVDRIVEWENDMVITEKLLEANLPLFSGHYPDHPIFPGALLCEALFQSGAILMALRQEKEGRGEASPVPVVTRILGAKFKKPVFPGNLLRMTVSLTEQAGNAYYFHGVSRVRDIIVATADFVCMQTKPPAAE